MYCIHGVLKLRKIYVKEDPRQQKAIQCPDLLNKGTSLDHVNNRALIVKTIVLYLNFSNGLVSILYQFEG